MLVEILVKRWLHWSVFMWLILFGNAGIINACDPLSRSYFWFPNYCHLWFENIPTLMWRLKSLCSLDQSRSHNMRMGHYQLQFFFFTLMLKQLLPYSGKELCDDYEHQSVCPPLVANPRCLVDWFCCTCHICSAFIHLHSKLSDR